MTSTKHLHDLQHIGNVRKEDDEETNVKRLGIFISKEQLDNAIKTYKTLSGFKNKKRTFNGYDDYTEGFCISNIVIDISEWEGGFTPSRYTSKQEEIEMNLPSWFPEDIPIQPGEPSIDFAERIMQQKYNTNEYPRGPQSEFYQIKKFKELHEKQLL